MGLATHLVHVMKVETTDESPKTWKTYLVVLSFSISNAQLKFAYVLLFLYYMLIVTVISDGYKSLSTFGY